MLVGHVGPRAGRAQQPDGRLAAEAQGADPHRQCAGGRNRPRIVDRDITTNGRTANRHQISGLIGKRHGQFAAGAEREDPERLECRRVCPALGRGAHRNRGPRFHGHIDRAGDHATRIHGKAVNPGILNNRAIHAGRVDPER